jgi:hypothetical protein
LFLTGYQPEKRCFAMTVLSDQTHTLFGVERKADPIKDEMTSKTFCQIFYPDHNSFLNLQLLSLFLE